jgi:hypothetical protein
VDFWDAFPDAIGEDMHMFIKVFLRTGGRASLVPLHIPINMCHISGDNQLKTVYARYLQVGAEPRTAAGICVCLP